MLYNEAPKIVKKQDTFLTGEESKAVHKEELMDLPRILLVIAGLEEKEALSFIRQVYPLHRFGYMIDLLADGVLPAGLKKYVFLGKTYKRTAEFDISLFKAVIASPSPDLYVKIAAGIMDTPSAKAAVQALLDGVDLYMDIPYIKNSILKGCKNGFLRSLYEGYEINLCQMGIHFITEGRYMEAFLENEKKEYFNKGKGLYAQTPLITEEKGEKQIVTKKDVEEYKGSFPWYLPADAVITPSARDAAAQRGLLLEKNKNRAFTGKEG